MRRVAAWLSMIVIAVVLVPAPPALAQKNEGLGLLGPRGAGLGYRYRGYRRTVEPRIDCKDRKQLGAIDRVVCSNPKLREKDRRLEREVRALKDIVDDAKATALDAQQDAWLDARKQCEGRRAVACLDRLYDARLRELKAAIVAAREEKNKEPEPD